MNAQIIRLHPPRAIPPIRQARRRPSVAWCYARIAMWAILVLWCVAYDLHDTGTFR